nr:hypothetical protein [Bdellovibrio bacteriovorus]
MGGLRFTPIYEALSIKAQKNSPPHIAFEELIESERIQKTAQMQIEPVRVVLLGSDKNSSAPLYSQRVQLAEMVITKNVETLHHATTQVASLPSQDANYTVASEGSTSWMSELPREQAHRLREANQRSEVLNQDWTSGTTWAEMAKDVLEKSGALKEQAPAASTNKVYVASTDANGQVRTRPSQAHVSVRDDGGNNNYKDYEATFASPEDEKRYLASIANKTETAGESAGSTTIASVDYDRFKGASTVADLPTFLRIQGPLEITGGLAVTNEHHIEVRRSDEGVLKELGKVDLTQGLYNIQVEGSTGTILARLVSKEGKIMGEGSFRLSQLAIAKGFNQGPKIKITPQPDFSGVTTSAYNPAVMDSAPANTRVTFVKGASEVLAKKDGLVAMDNVAKGSSTILRAAAPKHLQTASIIVSGQEFKAPLYPETMIAALQDIVSQQRATSFEGAPTIVWGKTSLDGKPVSGITVSVESDPSLQPVYFDQFMIPNPQLQATSENGIFAFVSVTPGFHSLLATRGDAIFGYQNVMVEEGSVALGDVEATMKFESVPMRVYDAFTGEGRAAQITMQSLSDELEVKDGLAMINLPQISRLGMMRVQPEGSDYVAARYIYNDKDAFVHLPLVHWSWLSAIKTYLKIDDAPSAGFIVGFVPDENFEVYLAGYDQFDARHIVYFDMQGRILQNRKGIAGGGFILYNVPEDTHEVVVVGERTQKIYSRVIPVDANSLSVLNFRE